MKHAQNFSKPSNLLIFLVGAEAFHTLLHTFLGVPRKTKMIGHPAEHLGFNVNRKFHLVSAFANLALTCVLARKAFKLSTIKR